MKKINRMLWQMGVLCPFDFQLFMVRGHWDLKALSIRKQVDWNLFSPTIQSLDNLRVFSSHFSLSLSTFCSLWDPYSSRTKLLCLEVLPFPINFSQPWYLVSGIDIFQEVDMGREQWCKIQMYQSGYLWLYYIKIFCIHSSIHGQLGFFHILVTVDNAVTNIGVHIYF